MKPLIEIANIIHARLTKSRAQLEQVDATIDQLRSDIERMTAQLQDLEDDKRHVLGVCARHEDEWLGAINHVMQVFSAQERFKLSPSEEIVRAFDDEVRPDLDE